MGVRCVVIDEDAAQALREGTKRFQVDELAEVVDVALQRVLAVLLVGLENDVVGSFYAGGQRQVSRRPARPSRSSAFAGEGGREKRAEVRKARRIWRAHL